MFAMSRVVANDTQSSQPRALSSVPNERLHDNGFFFMRATSLLFCRRLTIVRERMFGIMQMTLQSVSGDSGALATDPWPRHRPPKQSGNHNQLMFPIAR
jgi:hypothetical protein